MDDGTKCGVFIVASQFWPPCRLWTRRFVQHELAISSDCLPKKFLTEFVVRAYFCTYVLDHYGLPITRKSFQAQQLLAYNSSSGLNASAFFGNSVFEKFNSAWKRLKSTKKNLDTYFEHDKSFYRARELVRRRFDRSPRV